MKKILNNLHSRISCVRIGRVAPVRWLPGFFLGLLLLTGCRETTVSPGDASLPIPEGTVGVYFFWGEGCPHCEQAKPVLESLAQSNPRIVLRSFEIYYNKENHAIFEAMCAAAGFEAAAIAAAISMEERAIKLYSQSAKASADPEAKALYQWLSSWEREHLNALLDIDKALMEKIWFDNKFWPF